MPDEDGALREMAHARVNQAGWEKRIGGDTIVLSRAPRLHTRLPIQITWRCISRLEGCLRPERRLFQPPLMGGLNSFLTRAEQDARGQEATLAIED